MATISPAKKGMTTPRECVYKISERLIRTDGRGMKAGKDSVH